MSGAHLSYIWYSRLYLVRVLLITVWLLIVTDTNVCVTLYCQVCHLMTSSSSLKTSNWFTLFSLFQHTPSCSGCGDTNPLHSCLTFFIWVVWLFEHYVNPHFVRSHLSLFTSQRYCRHLAFPWCGPWIWRTFFPGADFSWSQIPSYRYDNTSDRCLLSLFCPVWRNIWFQYVLFSSRSTRGRSFQAAFRSCCPDTVSLFSLRNLDYGGIPLSTTLVVTPSGPRPARWLLNLSCWFSIF